ncbi:MAG: hypothetical protein M0C28_00045 [Candidatus Moduliflexus flocculans]|nr:hypothetical protein [Candidatus Moduliflexus flocculans]
MNDGTMFGPEERWSSSPAERGHAQGPPGEGGWDASPGRSSPGRARRKSKRGGRSWKSGPAPVLSSPGPRHAGPCPLPLLRVLAFHPLQSLSRDFSMFCDDLPLDHFSASVAGSIFAALSGWFGGRLLLLDLQPIPEFLQVLEIAP